MELPNRVLTRANSLLDDESRRILALQKALEEETEQARQRQVRYEEMLETLQLQEEQVAARKRDVEEEMESIRSGRKEDFLATLKDKEREAASIMEDIQALSVNVEMTKVDRKKAMTQKKEAVRVLRQGIESEIVEQVAEDVATALVAGEPVEEGKTLVVLEKGILFNKRGIVTKRNKGRGKVHLRVAGAQVKIERHLVGYPLDSKEALQGGREIFRDPNRKLTAKEREMIRMQEDLVDLNSPLAGKKGSKGSSARSSSNTVDVRGAEGQFSRQLDLINAAIDRDFDNGSLHVLHGVNENTEKLRDWLRSNPLIERVMAEEGSTKLRFIED